MVGADLLLVCKEAYLCAHSRENKANVGISVDGITASLRGLQLSSADTDARPVPARVPAVRETLRVTNADLTEAAARVVPSAIREVAVEVPGTCSPVCLYKHVTLMRAHC